MQSTKCGYFVPKSTSAPCQPQQPLFIWSRHTDIPNRNCQSDGPAHRNNFSPKWITMLRKLTKAAKYINWAVLERAAPNPSRICPGQPASCLWQWPGPGAAERGARKSKAISNYRNPLVSPQLHSQEAQISLVAWDFRWAFESSKLQQPQDLCARWSLRPVHCEAERATKCRVGISQRQLPCTVKRGYFALTSLGLF